MITHEQAQAGYEFLLRRMETGDQMARMWVEGTPFMWGIEAKWAGGMELADALGPCIIASQIVCSTMEALSVHTPSPVPANELNRGLLEALGLCG
jgi:hypothetical protein